MKKLFILSFLIAFFGFASATDINISNSLRLSENEGIVQLPTVTINFTTDTPASFDIIIPDYLIFQTPENITINGLANQPTVSLDHKKLTFNGSFTGIINIDGIKIRCYDENINGGKLGLDINKDGQADFYASNVIEQDRDGEYSDTMKPLPIKNAKYTLSGKNITLTRDPSPDLDLVNTTIEIYKNGGYFRYFTVGSKENTTTITDLDLSKDNIKIDLSAKDNYYMSETVSINIPKQESVVIDTTTTTKYQPTLKSAVLSYIVTKLDSNVTKYSNQDDSTIQQRNLFIKFLENFLKGTITVSQFNTQIVNHKDMLIMFKK